MPASITRRDDGIEIVWDPDRVTTWHPARALRLSCPCAECVEEISGRPLLDAATVPLDVRPVHLALVGTYGLRVHWSDGHATGIFTFARLRADPAGPVSR